MTRATGEAAARATEKFLAYHPAILRPTPKTTMRQCGCAGCRELATHVVVAGGAMQMIVCVGCGAKAIEADRAKPGKGWRG